MKLHRTPRTRTSIEPPPGYRTPHAIPTCVLRGPVRLVPRYDPGP